MAEKQSVRSPLCTVVGHVDHGKSSILDNIRGTAIVNSEAGKITQAIGASIVPIKTIKKVCGDLLDKMGMKFTIPGLLFIDTPGHAAFTNLRKRGGNLADIAVLVVDINEGFKPQTIEAIEILKSYKTPFVIAANKIDLLQGWKSKSDRVLGNISQQDQQTQQLIETKLYEIVGKLHEVAELNAERFDRVQDYTKQIAIVPTSAETGEGIAELLMVITGMAQRFLEKCLECNVCGDAKGTVLEVKEEKGIGIGLDVILYDGCLDVNDTIVIGTMGEPIVTKVRALFEPNPLAEMRDKKAKFKSVKHVIAATGVKISAPEIDEVVSGMPVRSCSKDKADKVKEEIKQEVEEVLVETDSEGIIIKADSLGSLEALTTLLKEKEIPVKKASVGNISKKDVTEGNAAFEINPEHGVILGFNVNIDADIDTGNVNIITNNVIYRLLEDLEKWNEELAKKQQEEEIAEMAKPCMIKLMPHYVFRQSNPAVCGVEVMGGVLTVGARMMKKDGQPITTIKSIQHEKENIQEAEKGKQVAASMEGVTVGRQINEGDTLYSFLSESEFRKLKELKKNLSQSDKEVLKDIAEIMRKENSLWGV